MLLLGIDVGTSSIKASVLDASTGDVLTTVQYPDKETAIISEQTGWAEQSPDMWWEHVQKAILKANQTGKYKPQDISAIGISYQMHGLVMVNEHQNSIRNSIIWCDSRAVEIGNKALHDIGESLLKKLLNSPGNFTASKLAWVKINEPEVYQNIYKIMLPGDFIAMKMTGEITTSIAALSEGVFWDFQQNEVSKELMDYFGFDAAIIPEIQVPFSAHGYLKPEIAVSLNLKPGIPISYKAGDQPNNALSLNVTKPGEVAANAGTSGVIYGVTDQLSYDAQSRVNTFAHVNYSPQNPSLGILLCINGVGSLNRWAREQFNVSDYKYMNKVAAKSPEGSAGLQVLPFGNGAERMLCNKITGAQFANLDLNLHNQSHIFRAVQEGIAFSFRYGLDILRENGVQPSVIRAGKANMFLSDLFTQTFVKVTGVAVELFESDGSYGAAIGAGIGAGVYQSADDAFQHKKPLAIVQPSTQNLEENYQQWKTLLNTRLS